MKKILSLLLLITIGCSNNQDEMIVNIYSQRHYDVDQLQYDNFEKETGIKVNVIKANADELLQRLKNEGDNSPADLFITCLLYTSPSPRDATLSRMPSSA